MVDIKRKVMRKIFKCAKKMGENEVGGLLLGEVEKDGNCLVTDIVLMNQKVSSIGFELDEDAMMDFTKNASAKVLKSVIGWWHSHGLGSAFWSPDDDRTFTRLCDFFEGKYCIGIVVATGDNKATFRLRLDIKDKNGKIMKVDNINPEIIESLLDFERNDDKELGDIEEKVCKDDSVNVDWETCPTCGGSGMKFSDEIDEGEEVEGDTKTKTVTTPNGMDGMFGMGG